MRNCFVPNCDSKCRGYVKRMMFLPPRNDELFEKWRSILPKKRQFRKADRICERHFLVADIQTTWDHIINGKVHQIERGKPKLKANAIPILNLSDDTHFTFDDTTPLKLTPDLRTSTKSGGASLTETSSNKHRHIATKNEQISVRRNMILTMIAIIEPKRKHRKIHSDSVKQSPDKEYDPSLTIIEDIFDKNEENVNVFENTAKNRENMIENDKEADTVASDNDESSFDFMYDDIYEIILPSTMYGIHRDPQRKFIVFSLFDEHTMNTAKCLHLDNMLNAKMYVHSINIMSEKFTSISVEILTNLLNDLDSYTICKGFNQNQLNSNTRCLVLATNEHPFCTGCQADN